MASRNKNTYAGPEPESAVTASSLSSVSTQSHWPVVATMRSARARPSAATASPANRPVMPRPTSAGVLGMARMMRSLPSHAAMLAVVMPAATLRCNAAPVWGAAAKAASLNVCGLTAQTMSAARASWGPGVAAASMPKRSRNAARAWSQGSTTSIWLAGWPWLVSPPMMALAMLPPPIKAITGCDGVGVGAGIGE